nr:hypothetical protein [uncultured Roseateles sp.]
MPSPALRAALIAASTLLLSAQAAPPDPLDAKAAVPPLAYRSAFQDYRPNVEAEVSPWREQNQRVGQIGGWRSYAKEAQQPGPPASAPTGHQHH